jgi:hypothetical protein
LVQEGGFLYDSDAYNDDLPYFVQVGDQRHLVLPYAFDTNDMQFFHTNRFSGAADFKVACVSWSMTSGSSSMSRTLPAGARSVASLLQKQAG